MELVLAPLKRSYQLWFYSIQHQPLSFYSAGLHSVIYTDNCLMFAHDDMTIDDLCKCLLTKFLQQDEGNIANYLGIQITHATKLDGSITITRTQPGLIDQILEDVGLTGKKFTQKYRPTTQVLQPNPTTTKFNASWNYHSIIRKLNFLTQNTHSMPIHMCSQYVNNSNHSHQDAMKYLCRYLHYT